MGARNSEPEKYFWRLSDLLFLNFTFRHEEKGGITRLCLAFWGAQNYNVTYHKSLNESNYETCGIITGHLKFLKSYF